MATVEDERVETRVDDLERLWAAPAAAVAAVPRRTLPSLGRVVTALWGAFLLGVLVLRAGGEPRRRDAGLGRA